MRGRLSLPSFDMFWVLLQLHPKPWRTEAIVVLWSHGFLAVAFEQAFLCGFVDVVFEFEEDLEAMSFEYWASALI